MHTIKIFSGDDLKKLSLDQLTSFRSLLKKELWSCLEGKDPLEISSAEIFAVVAMEEAEDQAPAGFIFLSFQPSLKWARIQTIQVANPSLFMALGQQLLNALGLFLKERHSVLETYIYSKDSLDVLQLEALLKQNDWTSPRIVLSRYHFDALAFMQSWTQQYKRISLPDKHMKFFPWKKLKPHERKILMQKQQQGTFPSSVSPFYMEKMIEPINSLGIRYNGEIIAWVVTHRLDADTIGYSSIYVIPEFRNSLVSMCLMAKSIELHQKSGVPKAILELNPNEAAQSWITFVKKRLVKETTHIEQIVETYRALE